MSILDNEELMRKALSLLRNLKEKTFSPAKRSEREVLEEAFQSVKDLKRENNLSPIGGSIE